MSCEISRLDSARLADHVNKYVAPPVLGIESGEDDAKNFLIRVLKSDNAPHIMSHSPSYINAKGKEKPAFHVGQIYVRHASKTEPATADDLQNILREALRGWFRGFGQMFSQLSAQVASSESAVPVRVGNGLGSMEISFSDPNADFPYSTRTIGEEIGKNQNWVARSIAKLGLKADKSMCLEMKAKGGQPRFFYSQNCVDRLRQILKEDPSFNPYVSSVDNLDSFGRRLAS